MRLIGAAVALFALIGCRGPTLGPVPLHDAYSSQAPGETYLRPNFTDADGTPAYVHFTQDDMPLRVVVRTPYDPPSKGSPDDARRAAVGGIMLWERALQLDLPWFDLEFTDDPKQAHVVVAWTRAMASSHDANTRCILRSIATLEMTCVIELVIARAARSAEAQGGSALGGLGNIGVMGGGTSSGSGIPAIRAPGGIEESQTKRAIENLAAHEFGHVLGLGHCACDSIMGRTDSRLARPEIRDIDRRTLIELQSIPNGTRTDGKRLSVLPPLRATDDE